MTHHDDHAETYEPSGSVWMRGLFMVIFAVFFGLSETLLLFLAVVQFFWMLFKREKNAAIAAFGTDLGKWLAEVAAFQTGATDDKPFPWGKWGR